MKEYHHGLTKNLLRPLWMMANLGGGPVSISEDGAHIAVAAGLTCSALKLDKGQYTNIAKLAYWGLTVKANPKGGERGGIWKMTGKGWQFIRGELDVMRCVWVYRGTVFETDGGMVNIEDVTEHRWKYRPEYAREGRPHDPNKPDKDLFDD